MKKADCIKNVEHPRRTNWPFNSRGCGAQIQLGTNGFSTETAEINC